ncbi:MAG: nucleotidyltransferase family protein, partial [Panacagrimonas sp.]
MTRGHAPLTKLTALVLAGSRAGGDPLAEHAGVSHKALIDIGGQAMIERVVAALAASPSVARIVICIERPELLTGLAGLRAPACTKPLEPMPAAAGPSASVAAALEREGTPLLVVTGDHPLMRAEWIESFLAGAAIDADVAVALSRRDAVMSAVPDTQRTW